MIVTDVSIATGSIWQMTVTIIILALAIVFVSVKAWRMFHKRGDSCDSPTCSGCPIKDACNKKETTRR